MASELAKKIEKKYFGQKKKHWFEDEFFKQRVNILKSQLSEKRAKEFESMDFQKQKRIITAMIHKGLMI